MGLWWLLHKKTAYQLAGIGLVVALIYALRSDTLLITLPNKLQDTITLMLSVLYEAMPFVVLGVMLSALVQTFVPQNTLINKLPKNEFVRRFVLSLTGTFLPVCECGNVPLARGFMIKGLAPSDVLTFLFSAPIVNPITILTTVSAFGGWGLAVRRVLFALVITNIIGWIYSKRSLQASLVTEDFLHTCKIEATSKSKKSNNRLKKISSIFRHELRTLLPALIAGSLVAGIIQTTIPRQWLLEVSSNPVLSIIVMMALAGIVSICASVDAFFALSVSNTFSTGAVLGFLLFGPMIDIKMLSLLRTTFTKRILIELTILIATLTLLAGLVVDNVL